MARGIGANAEQQAACRRGGQGYRAPMQIRPATPDDDLTDYEGSLTGLDCFDDGEALVAVDEDGQTIGNLIYTTDLYLADDSPVTFIEHAWVQPAYRGRGIFSALLQRLGELHPIPMDLELGGNPSVRAACEAWNRSLDGQSGDGFVTASDGREYWGKFGASGCLFRHGEGGEERFFLILRAMESEDGGVWGSPGGARNRGEDLLQAALRETGEEIGEIPAVSEARFTHVFDPGFWRYTTFVVDVDEQFEQTASNWETDGAGWFTRAELKTINVHPGVLNALAAFDAAR
jgi:8-oxo-dGTP pyrophosphatase MutT (NUDIX family)